MNPARAPEETGEAKTFFSPNEIRRELIKSLEGVAPFSHCALLDAPDYFNVGDHLIWMGLLIWVLDTANAQVDYAASQHTYSAEKLAREAPAGPIIFTGGGNFGDLWIAHQRFREEVIERFPKRPVVLMPQSILFQKPELLLRAQKVFNRHPDFTIFARDDRSFELARRHFSGCKIIRAPDIAFQLSAFVEHLPKKSGGGKPVLIQQRRDQETDSGQDVYHYKGSVVYKDWETFRSYTGLYQRLVKYFPFLWRPMKEDEMLRSIPEDWHLSWRFLAPKFRELPGKSFHLRSLQFTLQGAAQMERYRMVVTDRLHGHILCVLLQKPNVLLPNAYYKNEAFYHTWTKDIPYASFNTELPEVA